MSEDVNHRLQAPNNRIARLSGYKERGLRAEHGFF